MQAQERQYLRLNAEKILDVHISSLVEIIVELKIITIKKVINFFYKQIKNLDIELIFFEDIGYDFKKKKIPYFK